MSVDDDIMPISVSLIRLTKKVLCIRVESWRFYCSVMEDEENLVLSEVKLEIDIAEEPVGGWMMLQAWHAQEIAGRQSQHSGDISSEQVASGQTDGTCSEFEIKKESENQTAPNSDMMEPHDMELSTVKTEPNSDMMEPHDMELSTVKTEPNSDMMEPHDMELSTVKTEPNSDMMEPHDMELSTVKTEPGTSTEGYTAVPDIFNTHMSQQLPPASSASTSVRDTFSLSQDVLPASSTIYPTTSSAASEEFAIIAEANENVINISAIVPEVPVHCELEDTVIHVPVTVSTPPSASTPATKKGNKRSLSLRKQHGTHNSGRDDDEARLWKEFLKSEIKRNESEILKNESEVTKNEMLIKKMENDMREAQEKKKRDDEEFHIRRHYLGFGTKRP